MYIHIPFCQTKCGYCSFYSVPADESIMDAYANAVQKELEHYGGGGLGFDTLYFGGGTPSLFGGRRLKQLIEAAKRNFDFASDSEITVEVNPSSVNEQLLFDLVSAGVNRISMGVQSADESQRRAIGRISSTKQIEKAALLCKRAGIENLSMDLMLGLPNQTAESVAQSVDFLLNLGAKHISAYMLSLSNGCALYKNKNKLNLPSDDETADLYLFLVDYLAKKGLKQYEISNFCAQGFESRHNLKYWKHEPYLGIGPSAHSFIDSKRFHYSNSVEKFLKNPQIIDDGKGGDEEEFIMLRLRLTEGFGDDEFFEKFHRHLPKEFFKQAEQLQKYGLLETDGKNIHLLPKGFLVSNSIITQLVLTLEQYE